ncbi:putative thiamine transport system ATP-binding protein [Rhodoligotrophos appendicifer]|uniref:ATP-binding cassette domain-containing protein n=1 Tax=Rhodoligotrophos appendicifer TaxID=987056 RepID=UPI001186332C|nr:ATP-binding cassette domain-containing protein [Rhodoligotrophos appendicifer]
MKGIQAAPFALHLRDVTITVLGRTEPLVDGLSLIIEPGMATTLMGASGSGKSTLLAYIGGFIDRSAFHASGQISIGTELLSHRPPEERRLGVLFQDAILFPHLSVGGNLLFGIPRTRLRRRDARRAVVEEALASAGLAGYADRDPATLSGGQKARVALLRTLLAEPRALLLDEPFGKLDVELREEFRDFVFSHILERGLPALLVTHDPADATATGGPVVSIDKPLPKPA